jgi:rod shape-determining protein MreB
MGFISSVLTSGFQKIGNSLGVIARDIAIDLGTANTLVYEKGKGVVLNEPSFVSIDDNGKCIFGTEAKLMMGKAHSGIRVTRPLKDGVITNPEDAKHMINGCYKLMNEKTGLIGPLMVICTPSGATPVENKAIQEAAESSGARDVYLITEPMAAAIGAGLSVNEPRGSMIVDIGGGTTEIAIISLGGIVYSHSIRIGGDAMDEAIVSYIRRKYNLLIGEITAEKIKKEIGAACVVEGPEDDQSMVVKGRDLVYGIPKEIVVTQRQIAESLFEPVSQIVAGVLKALEASPPELASDISDSGIWLSGGSSMLKYLDFVLKNATKLIVRVADNPLFCVINGIGIVLENLNKYKHVLFKQE